MFMLSLIFKTQGNLHIKVDLSISLISPQTRVTKLQPHFRTTHSNTQRDYLSPIDYL